MSLSKTENLTRATIALVSVAALAGCSLGKDVRYKRSNLNKNAESSPSYAVAFMRQETVPMGEKKFWWSEQERQCGAYKTNLPACSIRFGFKFERPQKYTAGMAGNWARVDVEVSFTKEKKTALWVPDELNQTEAAAMITQTASEQDVANLAVRVAEYAICQGGQVRLSHDNGERISGAENMKALLAADDVSRAISEIDPAFVDKIGAVEQGRNAGWIVRLECSLWGDGSSEEVTSVAATIPTAATNSSNDLRAHVDALLNAQ